MWRVRAKGIWETPLGCVGLAALTVGVPAGIMIVVVCAETTPKEADQTLTSHSSLIGLCELPPRYFTESAPRTETGPAPV
ncbi:hypothetical protein AB0A77_19415 [Streptomyces varsoviensis]|uniref:hypothetical protein n=1 Tax=Streptomyces varsoviensis TaxID=67373 RepID=UPI0034011FDC